jgi:hypothetical protein
MIITLDLSSGSMLGGADGRFSEPIVNLPFGRRVKIISVVSLVSIANASISPYMYIYSNLIQNQSYDSLTNGTTSVLQAIDLFNHVHSAGVSTYYTNSNMFQFDTVIPETITIEKRSGIGRTLLNDGTSFHIRICMETIDN